VRPTCSDCDEDCRCSARQFAYPAVRSDVIGFRVARSR